jgi:hypothetical protein
MQQLRTVVQVDNYTLTLLAANVGGEAGRGYTIDELLVEWRAACDTGLIPDTVTVTAVLKACRHASQPTLAQAIYDEALRLGCVPNKWVLTALLQAHEPTAADAAGSGGIEGGAAGGKEAFDWRTAGWLEVAASIEKPVLSLNSEYSNRKDEHAFSRALRAGQLEVLEGATHCTLEQDSLEAFRYYLLDWLRIVHPIAD